MLFHFKAKRKNIVLLRLFTAEYMCDIFIIYIHLTVLILEKNKITSKFINNIQISKVFDTMIFIG